MKTTIMGIHIDNRQEVAGCVQALLTEYGCIIKTRLGLHEMNSSCSTKGLVILEFFADSSEKIKQLMDELNKINGASAKIMEF